MWNMFLAQRVSGNSQLLCRPPFLGRGLVGARALTCCCWWRRQFRCRAPVAWKHRNHVSLFCRPSDFQRFSAVHAASSIQAPSQSQQLLSSWRCRYRGIRPSFDKKRNPFDGRRSTEETVPLKRNSSSSVEDGCNRHQLIFVVVVVVVRGGEIR